MVVRNSYTAGYTGTESDTLTPGKPVKSRTEPPCRVGRAVSASLARGAGRDQGKVIGARPVVLVGLRWSDHMCVALVNVGGGIVAKWRRHSVKESGQKP